MRRDRGPRGLFEYRDQWIDQEPDRPGYYRYWYDDGSRRVKRRALAAADLPGAKEELIDLLADTGITAQDPSKVLLADALAHYLKHYAEPAGYKPMAAARRSSQLLLTAMGRLIEHPKVADLTLIRQQRCWEYLATREKLSAKSISTYMISVRAALNYCARPHIITVDDQRLEARLLDSSVTVICNEAEIADYIGKQVSTPREYIPTFEDLGRWIDAIEEEDDFRYVIIALNTAARNEAIFDLRLTGQVDFEFGLIDLNPARRRQTKKRRPVLKMTTNLAAWLKHWDSDRPIAGYQDRVEKRINAIGKRGEERDDEGDIVKPGWLPEMTCYVLRHFIATHMRRTTVTVSREQRSKWLGHTIKEGSKTTDWYEKFDPDYLEAPMRATEEIIRKLQKHTKRKLFAPTARSQGKVRIIEGGKKSQ
jgi:hypothetical protein